MMEGTIPRLSKKPATTLPPESKPSKVIVNAASEVLDESSEPLTATFPIADFAMARKDSRLHPMPQIIAHRGYKAKFPENTMLAFEEAIKAGAMALETDIHLTRDGVVVLSHDANLKRCFGSSNKIVDCTWPEIKEFQTLAPPHMPMPSLEDLLSFLARPQAHDIWLLLDVKPDNSPEEVMRRLQSTIADAPAVPDRPWKARILLGLWAPEQALYAAQYLPELPAVHIGFKISYADKFLERSNVGVNMLTQTLLGPGGRSFLTRCRQKGRQVIVWTVNDKDVSLWCARRRLDGVLTDDPAMIKQAWAEFDEHAREPLIPISPKAIWDTLLIYVLVATLFWYFRRRLKLDGGHTMRPKKD